MDIRTGRTYNSKEEALAAGVPESDIAEVFTDNPVLKELREAPKVKFSKTVFGSIKNAVAQER